MCKCLILYEMLFSLDTAFIDNYNITVLYNDVTWKVNMYE